MIALTKPETYSAIFARWCSFAPPFAAAGCLFGVTTAATASYREKDDYLNHMIAGAAAGPVAIAGFRSVNGMRFGVASFVAGIFALYVKKINDAGYNFYNDVQLPINNFSFGSRQEYNAPIFRPNRPEAKPPTNF